MFASRELASTLSVLKQDLVFALMDLAHRNVSVGRVKDLHQYLLLLKIVYFVQGLRTASSARGNTVPVTVLRILLVHLYYQKKGMLLNQNVFAL